MTRNPRLSFLGYSLLILVAGSLPAQGDFLTSLTVDLGVEPGGLTTYRYTLMNLTDSTLPAVEFTLNVAADSDIQSPSAPPDWIITYTPGDTTIDFASPSAADDIQPGSSAVFEFASLLAPTSLDYVVVGLNDNPFQLQTNAGSISAPGAGAVPEPSTLVLGGIGLLSLLGYVGWPRHLSRRHRRADISSEPARPAR